MNAAFMSFQPPRERGIHAVWSGAGGARGTEVRFRRAARPVAGRERTTINLTRAALCSSDMNAASTPPGARELRAVGLDRQTAQDKGGRDLADQPDVRG
jgi:hypothetical protein